MRVIVTSGCKHFIILSLTRPSQRGNIIALLASCQRTAAVSLPIVAGPGRVTAVLAAIIFCSILRPKDT